MDLYSPEIIITPGFCLLKHRGGRKMRLFFQLFCRLNYPCRYTAELYRYRGRVQPQRFLTVKGQIDILKSPRYTVLAVFAAEPLVRSWLNFFGYQFSLKLPATRRAAS
jgi:hypothetical protein